MIYEPITEYLLCRSNLHYWRLWTFFCRKTLICEYCDMDADVNDPDILWFDDKDYIDQDDNIKLALECPNCLGTAHLVDIAVDANNTEVIVGPTYQCDRCEMYFIVGQ